VLVPAILSTVRPGRATEDVHVDAGLAVTETNGDDVRTLPDEFSHLEEPRALLGYDHYEWVSTLNMLEGRDVHHFDVNVLSRLVSIWSALLMPVPVWPISSM
jgi:hypothetical protein